MSKFEAIGTGIFVHEKVKIGKNVTIGHCSYIGYGNPEDGEIIIEDDVFIGAYCIIYFGAVIKKSAYIDNRCTISGKAEIGKNTQVLSGKEVSWKAVIGNDCIICGDVADRTIIEDDVTYLGEIAHTHKNASLDWDTTEEPSPIIYKGSVVGVNALIIGPRKIGPCAYIGAGEIVRTDVGEGMALMKGEIKPLSKLRGQFKSRCK